MAELDRFFFERFSDFLPMAFHEGRLYKAIKFGVLELSLSSVFSSYVPTYDVKAYQFFRLSYIRHAGIDLRAQIIFSSSTDSKCKNIY